MKVLVKVSYILMLLLLCSWQVQAESVNNQAKEALSHGHLDMASDLLNKQVQAKSDDYQAWFLLGVAQARGQHFHQAIEAFRRVIELRDDLAEPHNNLAVIYNELGDVKAAVYELEQSLKKHPGYAVAEENIADLYVKLALQYYKKALLKNEGAGLSQRYARLLQVRDTQSKEVSTVQVAKINKSAPVIEKPAAVNIIPVKEAHKNVVEKAIVQSSETVNNQLPKEPSRVEKADKTSETESVQVAIEAWRKAWQSQNLDAYFTSYAGDYVPTGHYASLQAWKAYKRRVIENKTFIKVDVSDVNIELSNDGKVARVRFKQGFHSNTYNGSDIKVLKLEHRQQGWKIVREASISS